MKRKPVAFCLDLEGILLPEIWIQVARRFSVEALKRTTRDEPDYALLMRYRLALLRKEGIRLRDIQRVIGRMRPLPGAAGFLKQLQAEGPVIILSDTYYEFARPIMGKLGHPALLCNRLEADRRGYICGYHLRQKEGKRKAVLALKGLGFEVRVVGDSYNDLGMLLAADRGVFFNPPPAIRRRYRKFPAARDYKGLLKALLR
jgi:phosphoserine/homoserine phosphotransferase